jgi:hypothetical protein
MAVVPYYDQTKVKADIRETSSALDTQLDHWGEEAENEIDDMIYDKATKQKRITALPVLPFASGSVPESIQGAADNYVKMKFYEYSKNLELTEHFRKQTDFKVQKYIDRLAIDNNIYFRIAR